MDNDTTEPFCFPAIGHKRLTAAFDGGRLTSDGGVMLLATAERELGICDQLAALTTDPRDWSWVIHPLVDILRARIPAIVCGCGDADDVNHLRHDPGFKFQVGLWSLAGDRLGPVFAAGHVALGECAVLARGDPADAGHGGSLLRPLPPAACLGDA